MAFLALISLLSSSAWAFSPEVLFDDSVSSAQVSIHDVHLIKQSHAYSNADNGQALPDQFCNHACHISAHITAIETHEVVSGLLKPEALTFKIESTDSFTNPVLKSLYRPPVLV